MSNNAYDKGYQAYLDGQDLENNPFEDGSDEFFEWEGGWVAASDDDDKDKNW